MHRVQRVPVTESQGRIHTSAAGVWVMPEAEEVEVTIDPNDLRIDVFRSSGPGGQSVNTTDSAVRITHLPTGLVVSCQNEKSQLQNREAALRVLRARLHQVAMDERHAADASVRASQVRTVDRSERIRTYNFPENRISDHRTGFKAHNLDTVLDGDLDPVIQSCVDADEAARLAATWPTGERPAHRGRATRRPRLAAAGIPSPEVDAVALAAHALGVDAVRGAARHGPGRATSPRRMPRSSTSARRACRCSTSPGVAHFRTPHPRRRPRRLRAPARDRGDGRARHRRRPRRWSVAAGRRPLHRLGRDRARRQGRGPRLRRVHAVELSDLAHGWAVANRDRLGLDVDLRLGDATTAFDDFVGEVDVVVSNPPYIPVGAVPVDPEVRDHDPEVALYGGSADGLAVPVAVAARAAVLLRDGGVLVMEHADSQGGSLPAALRATGTWDEVVDHPDLSGRPRTTVAVRAPRG